MKIKTQETRYKTRKGISVGFRGSDAVFSVGRIKTQETRYKTRKGVSVGFRGSDAVFSVGSCHVDCTDQATDWQTEHFMGIMMIVSSFVFFYMSFTPPFMM
jgi:hypothetical protein